MIGGTEHMDINNIAINSIKSDYIRNYIASLNHKFTLEEQLVIIYNSELRTSEKVDIFKNTIDYVEDTGIRDALSEYIDSQDYYDNKDNKYCYVSTSIVGNEYCSTKIEIIFNNMIRTINKLGDELNLDDNYEHVVHVFDIKSGRLMGKIRMTNGELMSACCEYSIDVEPSSTMNRYVNIPNDIEIGDIVYIADTEDKFVVVGIPRANECLIDAMKYSDETVSVVPISILNNEVDYKKQIEDVYRERIKNVEKPEPFFNDIIALNHFEIHITDVEKYKEGKKND